MVIRNFHIDRPFIRPNKADSILLVDPDAVLPASAAG
jgi:hypothetical protein